MPKLLFVSNLFPDKAEPYRGLDNATLLHHLRDFETRVISPRPSLPFAKREHICREEDRAFHPRYVATNYVPKIGSAVNHRLMSAALRGPICELREKFPFDLVLASWIYPDGCAIARLAAEMNFSFAVIAQGSDVHQYLRMPLRRRIIVESMRSASAIITRSAELARLLDEAGIVRGKLHPIYNGVDLNTFVSADQKSARAELGIDADACLILFVGNFYDVKNPQLLIRAHADLCKVAADPRYHLVLIGGGPLEHELRALSRECGFGELVHFAGRKSSSEVARYMQAADVLCLPSENEGVPNVILEAFASGLRVVASGVGGIPEVLREDFLGQTFERGDLQDLVFALAQIFATEPNRDAIRNYALQFSWDRAAAAYYDVLNRAHA